MHASPPSAPTSPQLRRLHRSQATAASSRPQTPAAHRRSCGIETESPAELSRTLPPRRPQSLPDLPACATSPRVPPRKNQISSTVRCATAIDVLPAASSKWATLPPLSSSKVRTSVPSGAIPTGRTGSRVVLKSLISSLIPFPKSRPRVSALFVPQPFQPAPANHNTPSQPRRGDTT
jgi:hypothetical protein